MYSHRLSTEELGVRKHFEKLTANRLSCQYWSTVKKRKCTQTSPLLYCRPHLHLIGVFFSRPKSKLEREREEKRERENLYVSVCV